MELTCPDCRGSLRMAAARSAVCEQHGGRYEILFDRDAPAAPSPSEAVADVAPEVRATCATHPRQAAVAACNACGKQLCTLCSYEVNGRAFCGDCGVAQASVQRETPSVPGEAASQQREAPRAGWRREPESGACADHPEVPGAVRCMLCAKWLCATCDFALPGGVHLCSACIETQSVADVNPKRKKLTYIAMALAVWSTILCALMFGGAFNSLFTDDSSGKVADLLITNITLWPLLIGTGLSVSALDKKLKNTGLMKAVAWWNGILAGLFLLLIIAANLGILG